MNPGKQANSVPDRARFAATLIEPLPFPDVHDLGCGQGVLRDVLRKTGSAKTWNGYDLEPECAGARTIDLSQGLGGAHGGIAAVLGVVEYFPRPVFFIREVSRSFGALVVSYVPLENPLSAEGAKCRAFFLNHFTREAFDDLLRAFFPVVEKHFSSRLSSACRDLWVCRSERASNPR